MRRWPREIFDDSYLFCLTCSQKYPALHWTSNIELSTLVIRISFFTVANEIKTATRSRRKAAQLRLFGPSGFPLPCLDPDVENEHRGIAVHTRGLGCFCTKGKSVYTLCACSLNMTKSRNLFLVRFHCIDIVQFCILAAVFEWRMDVSSVCETWLDCDISRWKKCSFLVSHRSISLFVLLRVQLKATRMWFSNVRVSVLFFLSHAKLLQIGASDSSPLLSRSLGTVSDGLLSM